MSEPDVSDLMTVAQAIAVIDAAKVTPRIITVPLETAQGGVLAEDVRCDRDYPPFEKSLMDGFAVRCADVKTAPVELRVVGEVAAGAVASKSLGAAEAMAIMTGAPLPPGADGIVPVEDTQRLDPARVRIVQATTPGRYIARQGSDATAGQVILRAGMRLEAAQLAAAATVGAATVKVFAAPRVAVLATGDELVPIHATPSGSQIRNSNSIMLVAQLKRMGCEVADLGVAADRPDAIRAALIVGLRHDVLIVTGGMSMGEYDYVPRLLVELGVKLLVTKLRIKPGKPFLFGTSPSGAFVFGLPGNPVSGFVCLHRLASRLLVRLEGAQPQDRRMSGKLTSDLPANGPREFYQPVQFDAASRQVHPLKWKGSADLFTLASANGLLVRKENEPAVSRETAVEVIEI